MNWKVFACAAVCCAATLSPAPIRDTSATPHGLPIQSAEQIAQEQSMNGTQEVVGSVLRKTNDDGTGPADIRSDDSAASNLAGASPEMRASANANISRAQQQLKLNHQGEGSPFLMPFFFLVVVGGGLFAGKTYLEKHGPAPKNFKTSEKAR